MLLATRQFAGSALRPTRSQPSTYFGQWLLTHSGIRKVAEIGSQPRAAASVTPFENGATAVTTLGGCGRCNGPAMYSSPISSIRVFCVVIFQYFPEKLYGGSLVQISRTWLIASRNISLRLASRLPNNSASDKSPPGLIPKIKRPSSMWSSIAIEAAMVAGWVFGILMVPVPRRIFLVAAAIQAMKAMHEVMFS